MPISKSAKKNKLVHGFGVNDAEFTTSWYENIDGRGVRVVCPYYVKWRGAIKRCYSKVYLQQAESYLGCTVCEEWKSFNAFKAWVDSQPNRDWINCHLDKDLLLKGNRVYSPSTCIFIPHNINTFVLDTDRIGNNMLGVSWDETRHKFVARCRNPISKKKEHIGMFTSELEAHLAWKSKKLGFAIKLASGQTDPRILDRLIKMYS
jgi:hypothetical protein